MILKNYLFIYVDVKNGIVVSPYISEIILKFFTDK